MIIIMYLKKKRASDDETLALLSGYRINCFIFEQFIVNDYFFIVFDFLLITYIFIFQKFICK